MNCLAPFASVAALLVGGLGGTEPAAAADPVQISGQANVVVIFTDDQGYGDVGSFGATGYETPNLDRMAREGMRLTDFYVSQAVCSASRASLLTGCYNVRLGITGALGPGSQIGLHPDEVTIADLARSRGYATAMVGKWHLGDALEFLPTRQGFESYYGIPYSHDMWPLHPENDLRIKRTGRGWPSLPMMEGTAADGVRVINDDLQPADVDELTTNYTTRAVGFIDEHADEPFLLYVAHSLPHVPLFVSEKFAGTQPAGLYGDVIREIDWSVGEVLEALERNGLTEKTFVVFCSDNGPWLNYGNHAGSSGPLREGKGTTFDGGVRTPMIMKLPGVIPAGSESDAVAGTIDLLPTIATLIGASLPQQPIDGVDLWPVLTQHPQAGAPHEALYFWWGRELQAVRSGRWKLHFDHKYRFVENAGADGQPGKQTQRSQPQALYDLEADIAEANDVAADHPDVVSRLETLAEAMRQRLGDTRTNTVGREVREPGRLQAATN